MNVEEGTEGRGIVIVLQYNYCRSTCVPLYHNSTIIQAAVECAEGAQELRNHVVYGFSDEPLGI